MSYGRFAAMIATSTIVMFVLMYLNTYVIDHVFFSETRVYMAILMGACMAIIMMGYMFAMYPKAAVNAGILAGAVIVFALALWLVRSQATVGQVSYMRAMIPHHSIAIMTSERAQITDPRVRKLADEIIEAQRREIAEMRYLVAELSGEADPVQPEMFEGDDNPEVMSLDEALDQTVIATLDPAPVEQAEADRVLGANPGCHFSRTGGADPILVARAPADAEVPAEGVMKLNGELVPLRSERPGGFEALVAGPAMRTEGVAMRVSRAADAEGEVEDGWRRWQADLVFELERGLTVGYRGFYACEL